MATYRPAFTPWIATTRRPTGIRLKRAVEGKEKQMLWTHHPTWPLLLLPQGQLTALLPLHIRDCTRTKHPASSYREGLLLWSWWWKEIFESTEFGCLPNALTHPSVCLIAAFAMPRAHLCSQARASWQLSEGQLSQGNCTYSDFACGKHNNTTQSSSPWNTFKPSHTFLHLPYAKRVHRQRPWPEECKLTWLCVCPCDPGLSREWRNSRRDSAPLWDISTAPQSGSALERTEEDKIFHYSVLLQSYWLKHCNHFLSVNYFIAWFPPSRPCISLKDSTHEYIH